MTQGNKNWPQNALDQVNKIRKQAGLEPYTLFQGSPEEHTQLIKDQINDMFNQLTDEQKKELEDLEIEITEVR